jgi:hypothetical protein
MRKTGGTMYDRNHNHCLFWLMSAELKSILVAGKSLTGEHGVRNSYCNIYDTTQGIEIVQNIVHKNGQEDTLRICQHFIPISFWYYKIIYARPAQLRWGNIIAPYMKIPNLICKLRGWKKINKL